MAGYLTTHVLDTARGRPAEGLRVVLLRLDGAGGAGGAAGGRPERLGEAVTNADGRTDAPILPEALFRPGTYELRFHCGDYLERIGAPGGRPRFLDVVPIRFGLAEARHHHVPLLLSPYGYSTYRGS